MTGRRYLISSDDAKTVCEPVEFLRLIFPDDDSATYIDPSLTGAGSLEPHADDPREYHAWLQLEVDELANHLHVVT